MKYFTSICAIAVALASFLAADTVMYFDKGKLKTELDATVESWNADQVKVKTEKGSTITIDRTDVSTIERIGGSMSGDLADAISLMGEDPKSADELLKQVAASGGALDKEEAVYRRGQLWVQQSKLKPSLADNAMKVMADYTKNYKKGYFTKRAHTTLAEMQSAAKRVNDARTTWRSLASVNATLKFDGNLGLGILEAREGKWADAISAFKNAEGAAGKRKAAKALATAWRGLSLKHSGKDNDAKTVLESVTGDESLEDDNTDEDERALSVAYPPLADIYFDSKNYDKAYDAYVQGGYYAWWSAGGREGYCISQAWRCAVKQKGTAKKWDTRAETLEEVCRAGFPREYQAAKKAIDAEKKDG